MNHALDCVDRSKWRQTYTSKDEAGNIVAFEFRCAVHHENFWLAIPPQGASQKDLADAALISELRGAIPEIRRLLGQDPQAPDSGSIRRILNNLEGLL